MEVIVPSELRPYQVTDTDILFDNFLEKAKENKYQKALFNAVMAYGKTETMIHYTHRLVGEDLRLFVVVAPALSIIAQTAKRFIAHDVDKVFNYAIFASQGIPGVKKTTDSSIKEYVQEADRMIIFTTYMSYNKLNTFIKPEYVIFDEFHRLNENVILEDGVHYLGMTATPLLHVFDEIVHRSLAWARQNGVVSNYKISLIVGEGDRDPCDLIEFILGYSKKLLVINRRTSDAVDIAETIPELCESVIGTDKYEDRRAKELRIANLERGALTSVNVYREGTDLPWLDSILYFRKPQKAHNMLQNLGRIIRNFPGKEEATIYFFVDIVDDTTHTKLLPYIRKYIRVLKAHDEFENNDFPCNIIADETIAEERLTKILDYVCA